jgi:hypothetical protein
MIIMQISKFFKIILLKYVLSNFKMMRLLYWLRCNLIIIPRLKYQLYNQTKDQNLDRKNEYKRILLPLIETNHYQHYQLLILAKALELRGASVRILVCGQSLEGCEIKSIRNEQDNDPCWKCRFNEKTILPLFGLETVKLTDVLSKHEITSFGLEARLLTSAGDKEVVRHGVNLQQSIEDSVVRYFYGATPADARYVNTIREAHTKTALMSIEVAHRIDIEWAPNIVLSNMACYSAWEPYYRYYRSRQKRYFQISISAFNFNSIIYNSFDLFPATKRFRKYMMHRSGNKLNKDEQKELIDFIHNRISGKSELFVENKYFSAKANSETIKEILKYDETKRNIFLFSNLYWDVGLSDRSDLFAGVLDWVIGTIEIAKNDQNCHLYIKPHPVEVFGPSGSLKGVAQFIKEKYPNGISNVTIIEPELKLNTYQLFPLIDVGVIFTGTLGLEMMLAGIPVISTGETSHKGLNLAVEPSTLSEYGAYLVGEKDFQKVSKDLLELFSYFYFIQTLIPWRLTKRVYADDFTGFTIRSLSDLELGRDPVLDHLCNCIVDPENSLPEAWSEIEHLRK